MLLLSHCLEFITPSQTSTFPMPQHIRDEVQKLVPQSTSCQAKATHYSSDSLQSAKFVFVRRDAHYPLLQHPYDGPYRVLDAGTKTFMLDKNGKMEHVSIDQLKQVHVDSDQSLQLNLPRPRGRPKKATDFFFFNLQAS